MARLRESGCVVSMGVHIVDWEDLDSQEILLHIRREVFVEEQRVDEDEEFDGLDPECVHFIATVGVEGGESVGTTAGVARLRFLEDGRAKAERFAVLRSHRGHGIGSELVEAVCREAEKRGHRRVVVAAQLRAEDFYRDLGFERYGEEFVEAGINHVMMLRSLAPE